MIAPNTMPESRTGMRPAASLLVEDMLQSTSQAGTYQLLLQRILYQPSEPYTVFWAALRQKSVLAVLTHSFPRISLVVKIQACATRPCSLNDLTSSHRFRTMSDSLLGSHLTPSSPSSRPLVPSLLFSSTG